MANAIKVALETFEDQTPDQMIESLKTKSAVIKYLASKGMSRGDIARFLDIRYQHVRNVLTAPVKKVKE